MAAWLTIDNTGIDYPVMHYTDNIRSEQPSTGSFGWKFAFQLRNGTVCSYGGYTKDMTGLPEGFDIFYSAIPDVQEHQ